MSEYDEKLIVKLSLTQKEVDALWLISRSISGNQNSMRNIFSYNKDNKDIETILKPYITDKLELQELDYINGECTF